MITEKFIRVIIIIHIITVKNTGSKGISSEEENKNKKKISTSVGGVNLGEKISPKHHITSQQIQSEKN